MYKMKTCSKFKKCFKVLGGGGLKRKRVGGNHFLLKKTKRVKGRVGGNHFLLKKTKRVKGLLSRNIILLGKIASTVKKRLFV